MIKNLEKKFNKNGYVIAKTKEKELLLKLQSKILELILASNKSARQNFKRFKNTKDFFPNLHKFISLDELNNFRVKIIKSINNDDDFREKIFSLTFINLYLWMN